MIQEIQMQYFSPNQKLISQQHVIHLNPIPPKTLENIDFVYISNPPGYGHSNNISS